MEQKQVLSLREGIRKRPSMYLGYMGARGITSLFYGVFKEYMEQVETGNIFFSVSVSGESRYSIEIQSMEDITAIIRGLVIPAEDHWHLYREVLVALSATIDIIAEEGHWTFCEGVLQKDSNLSDGPHHSVLLRFELDKTIFTEAEDYENLCKQFYYGAMLNRNAEILIRDETRKHSSQNYYHFPQGIIHLYKGITNERYKPALEIIYEGEESGYKYQIALCLCPENLWYYVFEGKGIILSFANDDETTQGGALVDGVLNGIALAFRKYIKKNGLTGYKVQKRKFIDKLILVCSVRGNDLCFQGPTKQQLGNKKVEKDVQKIISARLNGLFAKYPDKVKWLLSDFQV